MQYVLTALAFFLALAKAYVAGRKIEKAETEHKKNEVLNEIIEEAVKPVTVSDTADKLRSGNF